MGNKRIEHNSKIFNQIKNIEIDYINKIRDVLISLNIDNDLNNLDKEYVSGGLLLISLYKATINNKTYSDNEFKTGIKYDDQLTSLKHLYSNYKNFITLHSILNEGISEIDKLKSQYQNVRKYKRITIDNIENYDELLKFQHKILDNYINGLITMSELNTITSSLKKNYSQYYNKRIWLEDFYKKEITQLSESTQASLCIEYDNYFRNKIKENPEWKPKSKNELYFKYEFVYVFFNPLTNLFKIGITTNPKERLYSLSTGNGCKLKNILMIQLEPLYDERAKIIEKIIHTFFKNKRKKGEWFDLSIKDLIQIKNLFWEIICGVKVEDNLKKIFLNNK